MRNSIRQSHVSRKQANDKQAAGGELGEGEGAKGRRGELASFTRDGFVNKCINKTCMVDK